METQSHQTLITQNLIDLIGRPIRARDGEIGKCQDVLFDDVQWTVRYLVVETGGWLSSRKIVITPHFLVEQNVVDSEGFITVKLTKRQIENSPFLEIHEPISQQYEKAMAQYYQYPFYGDTIGFLGAQVQPIAAATPIPNDGKKPMGIKGNKSSYRLRSSTELKNYRVQGKDSEPVGYVEDYLVECGPWNVNSIVVKMGKWLPGRRILISSDRIEKVSWGDEEVKVDLDKHQMEGIPAFDQQPELDRSYEKSLFNPNDRPYH